jgi:hypothetical protein
VTPHLFRCLVILLLVCLCAPGSAAAQPAEQTPGPSAPVLRVRGEAIGGAYRLTGTQLASQNLRPPSQEELASGGSYRLLAPMGPTLRGSGCCCTYLPCVFRNFRK